MYASIKLKNFKCFRDEIITFRSGRNEVLDEIHLIGDNSSGKSSILSAFAFIMELTIMRHFDCVSKVDSKPQAKIPLTLAGVVSKYKTYNQISCLEVVYEIVINRDKYFYKLKFNGNNELVKESLTKDNGEKSLLIFSNDSERFELGYGVILKDDIHLLEREYRANHKKFTLLSLIHYLHVSKTLRLKGSIFHFVDFINLQQIHTDLHNHDEYFSFDKEYFNSPTHGTCNYHFTHFLNASAILMTAFLKVVHPKITNVKYVFEKQDKNEYTYEMYIIEEHNGYKNRLDRHSWPQSYTKSVRLCNAISDAYFNRVIVWDDIASNYHLDTLNQMLMAFRQYSKRQLIFSSSSSIHLNNVPAQSIFLVKYEDGRHFVENLALDHDYRSEHNVKSRYEKGLYQAEKIEKDPRLFKLIEWFTKHAISYGDNQQLKHDEKV